MLEHGRGIQVAVTIKDIAAAAGVSRGTVDRALHGRGGVSAEAASRIRRLAEEMQYQPNRAGLGLAALKKPLRIGLLLPRLGNLFFEEVVRGAEAAQQSLADFGLGLLFRRVQSYDPQSHLQALDWLAGQGVGGICAATVDLPEIREKVACLTGQGVPVVAVNTELSPCGCLSYVGCDYRQTGRIAAGLLLLLAVPEPRLLIVTGSRHAKGHNERIQGFLDRLAQARAPCQVLDQLECQDDDREAYRVTREALARLPQVNCLYVAGAGAAGVGAAVREAGLAGRAPILAFDDVPTTRSLVQEGLVPAIVCQQPFQQGYQAVKLLFRCLANGEQPPARFLTDPVIKIAENL